MERCQRCYTDHRTVEQMIRGVPHYCKGPWVRDPSPPPPTYEYNPRRAPVLIHTQGGGTVWDEVFAESVLNHYGIPKHLEDSARFSYDNSTYFKHRRYGRSALEERDAAHNAGEDGGQDTSKAPGSVEKGEDIDTDKPPQQEEASEQAEVDAAHPKQEDASGPAEHASGQVCPSSRR